MKSQSIIKCLALLLVCCAMLGCGKEDDSANNKPGSIYGTVTDKSTGECVPNAGVELMPKGLRTVTGTDGTFEFVDIDPGQYNLFITKVGYQDYKSNNITVRAGEAARGDVQIEKMPSSLQIVDNSGTPITEIDFGSDEGVTSKTFNIFNGGVETLDFTITESADWITSISQTTGIVNVGVTFPVIMGIDRNALSEGLNSTTVLITSPSAGGVELVVKATIIQLLPVVTTGEVTNITSKSAACGGVVTKEGERPVIERGICWSESPHPTINDNKNTNGTGLGSYSCVMNDLTNATKYYVRAYAKNGNGVSYGEEKSFETEKFPTFQFGGHSYYVAPDPGNYMEWSAANSYCNNLSLEGMTGWKMPTRDELVQMYADRNSIGGFINVSGNGHVGVGQYWSSTSSSNGHYAIHFYYGSIIANFNSDECHVRPIKRKN